MLSIRNRIHVIEYAAGISEFMSQEIKLVLKREVPRELQSIAVMLTMFWVRAHAISPGFET
jgi:hypothetical protein